MNRIMYNLASDKWLEFDKTSGIGRGSVMFKAPSWRGREDRTTMKVVRSGNGMKGVTIRQLGVPINDISLNSIDFPISGGDRQILVTTNAASLKAFLTSDKKVKGSIKSFTTASGLDIDVNDVRLDYGFPGDPGLTDSFQVSLIISMPDNTGNEEVHENISINGVLVKIYQEGKILPYLRFDKDFDQIEHDQTLYTIDINSNIEDYTIEISDCQESKETQILSDTNRVTLNEAGDPAFFNIKTYPRNLNWRVE